MHRERNVTAQFNIDRLASCSPHESSFRQVGFVSAYFDSLNYRPGIDRILFGVHFSSHSLPLGDDEQHCCVSIGDITLS